MSGIGSMAPMVAQRLAGMACGHEEVFANLGMPAEDAEEQGKQGESSQKLAVETLGCDEKRHAKSARGEKRRIKRQKSVAICKELKVDGQKSVGMAIATRKTSNDKTSLL